MMDINIVIKAESMEDLRDQIAKAFDVFFPAVEVRQPSMTAPAALLQGVGVQDDAPPAPGTYRHPESGDVVDAPVEAEKPKRTRGKAKDAPVGEPAGTVAAGSDGSQSSAGATSAQPVEASPSSTDTGGSPRVMSAAEAEKVQHKDTVAEWTEGGSTFKLNRDEVIDAARAFIAGHKDGKERGNAIVKGINASLGYGRVSELPDDQLQAFIDLLGKA
jgi:hypothetical protein